MRINSKRLDRESFLTLGSSHILVKTKSLGEVKLRHISSADIGRFSAFWDDDISDKQFVARVVHNQLLEPELSVTAIGRLPVDDLIMLAQSLRNHDQALFQLFDDSGVFFKEFRNALVTGQKQFNDLLQKAIPNQLSFSTQSIRDFKKSFSNLIGETSAITSIETQLSRLSHPLEKNRQISEAFRANLERISSVTNTLNTAIRSNIEDLQKWTSRNHSKVEILSKKWSDFHKHYDITESKAVEILRNYKWFVSPCMPITFISDAVKLGKKNGRQDKVMNALFIGFFENEDWHNLENMVNNWQSSIALGRRWKILRDCVLSVKASTKYGANPANAVLPTLITQIDGGISDFLTSKGLTWQVEYDDYIDKHGTVKKVGRKSQLVSSKAAAASTRLNDLALDIMLNVLFQRSQRGKSLNTPFNFNRHKIIHGEIVSFGRRDYLVRAFMVLDLLAHFR